MLTYFFYLFTIQFSIVYQYFRIFKKSWSSILSNFPTTIFAFKVLLFDFWKQLDLWSGQKYPNLMGSTFIICSKCGRTWMIIPKSIVWVKSKTWEFMPNPVTYKVYYLNKKKYWKFFLFMRLKIIKVKFFVTLKY